MITAEEYKSWFWKRVLPLEGKGAPEIQQAMLDHLQDGLKRYQEMDDEAKALVDDLSNKILEEARKSLVVAADSPHKRKAQRALASLDKKHYAFADVLDKVSHPPENLLPFGVAGQAGVLRLFQMVVDVLHDGMLDTVKGNVGFAILGVVHDALNAGVLSLHAIDHGLVNQGLSLLRTIHENVDKARLFHEQPKWGEFFILENDPKKRNAELRPSKVRTKLGIKEWDKYYSMFSKMAHTSRASIKTFMTAEQKVDEPRPTITFRIGGTSDQGLRLSAYGWLMWEAIKLLMIVDTVFEDRVNREELNNMYDEAWALFTAYLKDHFIPWAKANNIDTTEMEEMADRSLHDVAKRRGPES